MICSGTISRGVKAPIIKKGDNLVEIVNNCLVDLANNDGVKFHDKDVVCMTEAIVARAMGNYATIDDIATDVRNKMGSGKVGLIFPILSRNRFSQILRGISKGTDELVIMLSYPGDEVGNKLISSDELYDSGINPYSECFTEEEFRKIFPNTVHEFTKVDYIEYYKEVAPNATIVLANDPAYILNYTDKVIVASIHERHRHAKTLLAKGAKKVLKLDEIMTESINGSGYHDKYGVLGSNLATDDSVKLFPRDCFELVNAVQAKLKETFNVNFEVMVYGDGAFKDPQGGIWELADPVVSPGYTSGLVGTPNELKLKYLADNKLSNLSGEELKEEMKKLIREKDSNLAGRIETQGTTPRQLTDLLGSLADLTSGSGDKGTPIILIQNYFTNYATEE